MDGHCDARAVLTTLSSVSGLVLDCSNPATESVSQLLTHLAEMLKIAPEAVRFKQPESLFEQAIATTSVLRPTLARSLLGWQPLKPSLIDGAWGQRCGCTGCARLTPASASRPSARPAPVLPRLSCALAGEAVSAVHVWQCNGTYARTRAESAGAGVTNTRPMTITLLILQARARTTPLSPPLHPTPPPLPAPRRLGPVAAMPSLAGLEQWMEAQLPPNLVRG